MDAGGLGRGRCAGRRSNGDRAPADRARSRAKVNLLEVLRAVHSAADSPGAFAIIGAVARNAWAPPRATTDLDLTVLGDAALLARVDSALAGLGYRSVREQRADSAEALPDIKIFRCEGAELRQVDILVAKTPFEEEVLRRAPLVQVGTVEVPVASPEDLIVYKLLADRPRDREDIAAVVRTLGRGGRPLDWKHVERWARFWRIEDRCRRLLDQLDDT
ncbi:MAG: nucleotidyl transferase AbiEii/AbiGii toxin family protein [Candidatus Binatia bacterium]